MHLAENIFRFLTRNRFRLAVRSLMQRTAVLFGLFTEKDFEETVSNEN